jgi:periplasmic copper chaperone A
MNHFLKRIGVLFLMGATVCAHAQLAVKDAWVRQVVPGQQGTGAFMTLQASESLTLTSASSPWVGVAQLHSMAMQGDVMKMAPVDALPLAAGQSLTLKPGGYHVMLMDLKEGFGKQASVPLTLTFKTASGKTSSVTLKVPVLSSAPPDSQAPMEHGAMEHSSHMSH